MAQQTAKAEAISWELLQQMLQTAYEGKRDSLGVTIDDAIQVCVAAVNKHGRDASLTIKLEFKAGDEGGMLDIFADIDTKTPKAKPLPVRLYGSKQGQLFVDDPEFVGRLVPMQAVKKEQEGE